MEMISIISLVGIIVALIVWIVLVCREHAIVWIAPVCTLIIALLGGINLMNAYLNTYMREVVEYIFSLFPVFFLGILYGKLLEHTCSTHSFANKFVALVGPRLAVLSVLLSCVLMACGGIFPYVIIFVICPIGYAIYKEAKVPSRILPCTMILGILGITFLASDNSLLNLIVTICIELFGYLYLEFRVHRLKKKEDSIESLEENQESLKGNWLCALLSLLVIIFTLTLLPYLLEKYTDIRFESSKLVLFALAAGILVICFMNLRQLKDFLPTLNEGANDSVRTIMNTAGAAGLGTVINLVPGLILLETAFAYIPVSIPTSLLYVLPHSALVLTAIFVSNCKYKDSYLDILISSGIIPLVILVITELILKFAF